MSTVTLTPAQRAELVDMLWRIKNLMKAHGAGYVNMAMLLNDADYRQEILSQAMGVATQREDAELRMLAQRCGEMDPGGRLQPSREQDASGDTAEAAPSMAPAPAAPASRPAGWMPYAGAAAVLLLAVVLGVVLTGGDKPANVAPVAQFVPAPASPNAPAMVSAPASQDPAPAPVPAGKAIPVAARGEASASAARPLENAERVLRIHGSNTVGEKLAPELVMAFLKTRGATDIQLIPGATPVEKTIEARLPDRSRPIAIELQAHGSTTAFKDLESGSADMGMSSRAIKDKEVETLKPRYGDLSSPAGEHVIGMDGLAVIVHPANPLKSLTKEQVARVFSGEIKDWAELGAPAGAIRVYARDANSGTWDTFKSLVLEPFKLELSAAAQRYESSTDLSDQVVGDPFAIGFIGLPYIRNAHALAIADSADAVAVAPTPFTVNTEDYPLARRLYFYTPTNVANPLMQDLIVYALSQKGQDVVRQVGFVSQNIGSEKPTLTADAPSEYVQRIQGAERLSLNLRFKPGSTELDTKGQRDLERLVDFMAMNAGRRIMLFGFTDSLGEPAVNRALSLKRAQIIEQYLVSRGVNAFDVRGFGPSMPVASNDSEHGRNRNRRVEVWVI